MLNIVDELINNEILTGARQPTRGLQATDGEVEDKFTEFQESVYRGSSSSARLKDRGVTVDDLKQDIRRQLSVQKLINREVVAKISDHRSGRKALL